MLQYGTTTEEYYRVSRQSVDKATYDIIATAVRWTQDMGALNGIVEDLAHNKAFLSATDITGLNNPSR